MGTGRHDIWRVAVRCVWRALSSKSSSAAAHLARRAYSSAAAQEPPQQQRWPVIIVGAGPTGLALALWLGRYGVRSLVLERSARATTHPQAHYINNRTMEVLRPLQGLAAEVAAQSPPLDHWRSFRYGFSMLGELLGEVDHFAGQSSPHNTAVSPEPVTHLPQSRLLPLMLRRLAAPGGPATLLWSHRVTHVAVAPPEGRAWGAGGVRVLAERLGGAGRPGEQVAFEGDFVVAADGAHSPIRQQLGIPVHGDLGAHHLINIHFTSPTLGQRLLLGPPGAPSGAQAAGGSNAAAMLYFVFNRDVVGVVVAHDLQRGEFVAQVPFFPPLQSVSDFPEQRCRQLVAAAAGVGLEQLPDLCILQVRPWVMSAVVAERYHYQAPGDDVPRVFLAGDAAHRFPPAGGFGLNTGVQDAHNLAWKLALALRHPRPPGGALGGGPQDPAALSFSPAHLLRSYEAERRPVAEANCALSVRNFHEAVGVPSQLGLDPRAAFALDVAVNAVPLLPGAARKALLEAGLALGRAATTSWTPLRPLQVSRLQALFKSGITLRLQFPREDLGFAYLPSTPGAAVAPEGSYQAAAASASNQAQTAPPARDAPYEPNSLPGSRMPHLWLAPLPLAGAAQHGEVGAARPGPLPPGALGWLSTLDVVAGGGGSSSSPPADSSSGPQQPLQPCLTLFADCQGGRRNPWLCAAAELQAAAGQQAWAVPLQLVQVLPPGSALEGSEPWAALGDVEGAWHAGMGLAPGGALLARPDGHVAWRCTGPLREGAGGAAPNGPDECMHLEALKSAFARALRGPLSSSF